MKENLLDILMYMFENCVDSETGVLPDEADLRTYLDDAGFQNKDIERAFQWLEGLAEAHENEFPDNLSSGSIRVYSQQEMSKLDRDSRGFLLYLEQSGILDPISRELVIDRAMALEPDGIDLAQLKWVVLMVLFNRPGQEESFTWMEDLLFDDIPSHLH